MSSKIRKVLHKRITTLATKEKCRVISSYPLKISATAYCSSIIVADSYKVVTYHRPSASRNLKIHGTDNGGASLILS